MIRAMVPCDSDSEAKRFRGFGIKEIVICGLQPSIKSDLTLSFRLMCVAVCRVTKKKERKKVEPAVVCQSVVELCSCFSPPSSRSWHRVVISKF